LSRRRAPPLLSPDPARPARGCGGDGARGIPFQAGALGGPRSPTRMNLDRLYRWLLYFYPAQFRLGYRAEKLLLYREREQSEPPFALWIDLAGDVVRTAPREHLVMIWNDLSYAVRALRRTPVVTATVVITLALALGANTAIFSVVHSILLNPLP